MNLPQKIKEEVVEWRNGEPFTVKNLLPVENKVNEIIDYLESQQCSPFECPGTRQEEPKYTCKDFYKVHEGPCVNCVPKEEANMTKTIKELLDEIEVIFDYNLSLHKPEGRRQLERVISQVEALVRNEVLDEVEEELSSIELLPYKKELLVIINSLRPIKEIEEKV